MPRPAAPAHYPAAASVPDWSEQTLALMANLTPLERAFTEWVATGRSAADAHRMATGRASGTSAARQQGHKLKARPRVRAAIDAALKDRNVGARMDREWLIARTGEAIERLRFDERRHFPAAALCRLIKLLAELQGELPVRGQPYRPPVEQSPAAVAAVNRFTARVQEVLAEAEHLAAKPLRPKVEGPNRSEPPAKNNVVDPVRVVEEAEPTGGVPDRREPERVINGGWGWVTPRPSPPGFGRGERFMGM
jgi:hypothetical protein